MIAHRFDIHSFSRILLRANLNQTSNAGGKQWWTELIWDESNCSCFGLYGCFTCLQDRKAKIELARMPRLHFFLKAYNARISKRILTGKKLQKNCNLQGKDTRSEKSAKKSAKKTRRFAPHRYSARGKLRSSCLAIPRSSASKSRVLQSEEASLFEYPLLLAHRFTSFCSKPLALPPGMAAALTARKVSMMSGNDQKLDSGKHFLFPSDF